MATVTTSPSAPPISDPDLIGIGLTPTQNGIMEADGFKIVTNKKRNKPKERLPFEEYLTTSDTKDMDLVRKSQANLSKEFFQPIPDDLSPLNYALAVSAWAERVRSSIRELELTDYNANVFSNLGLALKELSSVESDIKEIICYGLGSCVKHWQSRFQLGFLIFLKKKLGNTVPVRLYDPDFTKTDVDVIQKEFELEVILENEEGNRKVGDLTIFYLPHCPHGLCNNVLRSNWVPHRLGKCIVIGNSFDAVCSSLPKTQLQENVPFLLCSSPLCVEYKLGDNYKFFEAFYQMSIHVFPSRLCDNYSPEFWLSEDEVEVGLNETEMKDEKVVETENEKMAQVEKVDIAEEVVEVPQVENVDVSEMKEVEVVQVENVEFTEMNEVEVVPQVETVEAEAAEMKEVEATLMENVEVADLKDVVEAKVQIETEEKVEETENLV